MSYEKIVEILLKNGANKDKVTKDGETALNLAARTGHKETANLLRSYKPATKRADMVVKPKSAARLSNEENQHKR